MMTEEHRKSLWHHFIASLRDIIVLGTVMSTTIGMGVFISRPYWEPFSRLPASVSEVQRDILELQKSIVDMTEPRIVEFYGKGTITTNKKVKPGDSIVVLYFLRRNVSCESNVTVRFYDIERNLYISDDMIRAKRAPVTRNFILFPVQLDIPENLPPGKYVYAPTIIPVDCGVYGEISVIPSEIFEVVDD